MRLQGNDVIGSRVVVAVSLTAGALVISFAMTSRVTGQETPAAAASVPQESAATPSDPTPPGKALKRRHVYVRKTPPKQQAAAKEAPAALPADSITGSVPKPSDTQPKAFDFAAQLEKAGASTCSKQLNTLATSTMGSVEKFNTVSNWSQTAGDKRAVSVAIGQKYRDGSAVPFSVSHIIAAPNRDGSCDGFSVQVFPSPLSCDKLQSSIRAQRGKPLGNLAGIPLMQDAFGRTMLVPTSANTCVLVAMRTVYDK